MRDRARDWSEQGRRPRGEWGDGRDYFSSFLPIPRAALLLARSSLSLTVDEKRKGPRAVYSEC